MKFTLGLLFLAAGHLVGVHSLVIPSADNPLDGDYTQKGRRELVRDRFKARSPQEGSTDTESLDIRTIIGTAQALTSTFGSTPTMLPAGLVTDTVTTGIGSSTNVVSSRSTLTVTETEIQIVTATVNGDAIVSVSSTNSGTTGFGGDAGVVVATLAPSAGAVVTVGGDGSFGGVVGAVDSNPSAATASTASSTTSSTITTTAAVATSSAPIVTLSAGDSFGGVVGAIPVDPAVGTSAAATTTSFPGFGGIPGVVSVPAQNNVAAQSAYNKRDLFTAAVSFSNVAVVGQDSISVSDTTPTTTQNTDTPTAAVASGPSGGTSIVVVTAITDVFTTVTISGTAPTGLTTTSSVDNGVDTATVTVTATLTASTVSATALPPISLSQIFPNCVNSLGNLTALANVTIPDMVLPSNLTLSQILGFVGGQTNCSEVLQLLGIGNSTSSLKRRDLFSVRRMLYNYAKGFQLR